MKKLKPALKPGMLLLKIHNSRYLPTGFAYNVSHREDLGDAIQKVLGFDLAWTVLLNRVIEHC